MLFHTLMLLTISLINNNINISQFTTLVLPKLLCYFINYILSINLLRWKLNYRYVVSVATKSALIQLFHLYFYNQ